MAGHRTPQMQYGCDMSLKIKCACGKSLKITLAHAGKKGKCAGCGKSLQIPSEEALKQHLAKLAAASAPAVTPKPKPVDSPPPVEDSPGGGFEDALADEPAATQWDEDDFDFAEPGPGPGPGPAVQQGPEANSNPFASPMTESGYSSVPSEHFGNIYYAGFWKRFVAAMVDGFLLFIIGAGFGFVAGLLFGAIMSAGAGVSEGALLVFNIVIQIISIVLGWLYYALQESSAYQGTFGKRAIGIKVTDLEGHPISFKRATGRFFGKYLSYISLLIGFLMVPFTKKKQALHDKLAGTLVIMS